MKLIEDLGMMFNGNKEKRRWGLYECPVCKKHFKVVTRNVKAGKSTKCKSCKISIQNYKHGYSSRGNLDTNYIRWSNMKSRCYNVNDDSYAHYGGRGIEVHAEWINNADKFIKYIESLDNANQTGYSIDRMDNNGNYEPNNLRWSSQSVQCQNTRKLSSSNKSGYRGVYKAHVRKDETQMYISSIRIEGKRVNLGSYKNPLDGAIAYDNYVNDNNLQHTTNF